jgi:hypothetical protein
MPRKSKKQTTATTITHSIPFPVDDPFTDKLNVREYSLADLVGAEKIGRENESPSNVTHDVDIQPQPAGINIPPATPADQGSTLQKITRHKGQRTQTFKAIYTITPIQYRTALDRLRDKTRKSIKEVLCEAIADCAVKHGLASTPGAIMGWPDWD